MADTIEFVNGLIVKPPNPKAPDFVKASISIKITDLILWLQGKEGEWVNIDVKEARGGKWYAAVSNFKPKEKTEPQQNPAGGHGFEDMNDDIGDDGVPF